MVFFRRRGRRKVAKQRIAYLPIYDLYENHNATPDKNIRQALGKSSYNDDGTLNNLPVTSNFYSINSDPGYVIYSFDIDGFLGTLPSDAVLNAIHCFVTAGRESGSQGAIQFNLVHRLSDGSYSTVRSPGPTAESTTSTTYVVCDVAAPPKETLNQYFLEVNVERYGGHVDGGTLQINYTVYE